MAGLSISDILHLFHYQFFQFALIGGIIAGVICAIVGLFLILRKQALLGDGLAHTSFGGIAVGLLVGISPLVAALIVSVIAVLGISFLRRKGIAPSDSAIAVFLALGFSVGLIIISIAGGFNVDLFTYLFGSILTITQENLVIGFALGIFVIVFIGVFYKELVAMTFDEDSARLSGIRVGALSVIFDILVAVTIVLSITVVGVILVVALFVLPGLTALQLKLSFRKTVVASVVFSIISIVFGLVFSAIYDIVTSGLIVFIGTALFLFAAAYRKLE